MIIGYARTSTVEQEAGLAAQGRDLLGAGADKVMSEQVSSVAARPILDRCLAELRSGDALMVTKPDRLARNTEDLLRIVRELGARGVGVILLSLGGERLDTRNPTAKLVLTIMGGIAAWEREIMLERQREGIEKARAEGKYKGRPPRLDIEAFVALARDVGPEKAARQMKIGRGHAYRVWKQARGVSDPPLANP